MPSRRTFLAGLAAGTAGVAGCVTLDTPSRSGRYPMPGVTDARTGRTDRPGPTGVLYPAWNTSMAAGAPPATPAVVDGTAYVLGSNGTPNDPRRTTLAAHEAATGDRLWETTILKRSADTLDVHLDSLRWNGDEGLLYAQTMDGVHALAPDGTERWFAPLPTVAQPWPEVGAPVLADGTLVAAAYGSRAAGSGPEVRGYDPATGGLRWRAEFPERADPWTLTAADGLVYVPFLDDGAGRRLVALTAATGAVAWSAPVPVAGAVTAVDGRLLVPLGAGTDEGVGLLGTDREFVWREPAVRRTDAGIAVADDRVFYATDGKLMARDLGTGTFLWSFGNGSRVVDADWTPTVAGDVVYALAEDTVGRASGETLFALDTESGAIRGSGALDTPSTTSSLAVVDGAAYLTFARGEVRCYETCTRTAFGRCVLG